MDEYRQLLRQADYERLLRIVEHTEDGLRGLHLLDFFEEDLDWAKDFIQELISEGESRG